MLRIAALTFVLLSSSNIALGIQDDDGAAIDNFIARQAKRERGEEYQEARKVLAGKTTVEEVVAATQEDIIVDE